MKKIIINSFFLMLFAAAFFSFSKKAKPKVLIFSKAAGYHYDAIRAGIEAIIKIGAENNFSVDTTTDSTKFTDKNLKQYAALIFLSSRGNLFDTFQKDALKRYIQKCGGFVGIHAAADAEYNWPWYGKMVGGYFLNHPAQQQAKLIVIDNSHPSTKDLPKEWTRFDEWYNYKNLNPDLHVLITIDETSYTGGTNGAFHPMAWWHNFEGGRVFYTEFGHIETTYKEPLFVKHLTGGILYAMGKAK